MTFYAPDPFDFSEFQDPLSAQDHIWNESWDNMNRKKVKPVYSYTVPKSTTYSTPKADEAIAKQLANDTTAADAAKAQTAAAAAEEAAKKKLMASSTITDTDATILGTSNKGLVG